jgi:hypothetical protein
VPVAKLSVTGELRRARDDEVIVLFDEIPEDTAQVVFPNPGIVCWN